jgi:hypothetical protein
MYNCNLALSATAFIYVRTYLKWKLQRQDFSAKYRLLQALRFQW